MIIHHKHGVFMVEFIADYVKNDGIKRLEKSGIVLENMFLQTQYPFKPRRASILTGKYKSHKFVYNIKKRLDPDSLTVSKILQNNGYQTSLIGKWHLKKEPAGFDFIKFYMVKDYIIILISKQKKIGKMVTKVEFKKMDFLQI